MKRLMLLLLFFVTCSVASYGQITFSSLTEISDGSVDTSAQIVLVNPTSNIPVWRGSVGELLKAISRVGEVIATGSIIDGTITNADISSSANIGIGKLDTTSADGVVSKSRLSNALDDVSGGGSGNISGRSLQLLTADGTDTLDFNSQSIDGWKIDLSTVTNTTINFTNPDDTVFTNYTIHFNNASTDTVNFADVLLDANGDTITQYIFEQGQIVPIYYDEGQDHYTTNYIELPTTTVTYNIGGGGGGSITEGTPTGENLPNLDAGSMYYDDDFFYVKTYQGWQYQGATGLRNLYMPRDSQLTLDTDGLRFFCMEGYGLNYNSNGLSQWNDLSGNANHATQSTNANKPAVGPAGTVIFDGEDDFLELPDVFDSGQDSMTVLILFEREIDTVGQEAGQRLIHYSQGSGANVVFYITTGIGDPPTDTTNVFSFARANSGGSPFVIADRNFPLNETHLVSLRMVEGDSIYQQVNNGEVLSDNYDNQNGSTDERYIGKDKDNDNSFYKGRMRLIAMWARKLSDSELTAQKKKIYDHFKIYRDE
jgi:hypothetical protein